jgi:hypothetical protein
MVIFPADSYKRISFEVKQDPLVIVEPEVHLFSSVALHHVGSMNQVHLERLGGGVAPTI